MAAETNSKLEFEHKPRLIQNVTDALIMIGRSSRHIVRNTDQLLGTFFQPIMFLLLFSAIYAHALDGVLPKGVSYIQFLMAGLIVQTVAFGSTTTALAVSNDLQKGIMDRFRSLPMSNLAVLTGHVVSDLFRNAISTVVLVVAGLAVGFRSNANFVEWLLIAAVILLFTLAFSWLAAIMGVVSKSVEGVQWLSFVLVFPLTFASTAFVPAEGMASVVRGFAANQPITHVVETVRGLMLGTPIGNHAYWAVGWCLLILLVAVPLASFMFKRKSTQ